MWSKQLILVLRIVIHIVGQHQIRLQQVGAAHTAQVGQLVLQPGQRGALELAHTRIVVSDDQALEPKLVCLPVHQVVCGRLQGELDTVPREN